MNGHWLQRGVASQAIFLVLCFPQRFRAGDKITLAISGVPNASQRGIKVVVAHKPAN